MWLMALLPRIIKGSSLKHATSRSIAFSRVNSSFLGHITHVAGRPLVGYKVCSYYCTGRDVDDDIGKSSRKMTLADGLACLVDESGNGEICKSTRKMTLAEDLACLVDEPGSDDMGKRSRKMTLAEDLACLVGESGDLDKGGKKESRMELKRLLELRIKKRVKQQFMDGKFQDLFKAVIADPRTLQDAYDCVRLNSNVSLTLDRDNICFQSMAEELSTGNFDVSAHTYSMTTRGASKETLVLPKLKLVVVQEAIRIALEVVYKPHFSKISHGCRSGRGHHTALKYISKEISNPDWWFTVIISKKMDALILDKLISVMEDRIQDPLLYDIIKDMFDAQVLNLEFGGFPKGQGLPQEGLLSPILMNIYLDVFDREFYRLSMKYEALNPGLHFGGEQHHSKLRSWFRRQLKGKDLNNMNAENCGPKIHCCRVMDELFFAVSGPKDVALDFVSEVLTYLNNSLHLDAVHQTEILPCIGPQAISFLGTLVRRNVKETPAMRAVHKLKEKVKLFALQKQVCWDAVTVRIGKKWLGHGLRKVKESEIKHLADSSSLLNQISSFRKAGMRTDHWYKHLIKIWMQDIDAKAAESEEVILSKYVAEPALPEELRASFYEFQKCAENYVNSETDATLALLPNSSPPAKSFTEVNAPIKAIKKRLLRYGLVTSKGYARAVPLLILQDDSQIICWFYGVVRRWLKWYGYCDNFPLVQLIIKDQVRKSCVRTLAAKYRIHESQIEKRFDVELSGFSSAHDEVEQEFGNESYDLLSSVNDDEGLMYGISYSGLSLLSLARLVSKSRPCRCFVMGCSAAVPIVYTLHVMERQKFPGWKTGFPTSIHPSLNKRRIGLCQQHLMDLYANHISLQSIDFSSW